MAGRGIICAISSDAIENNLLSFFDRLIGFVRNSLLRFGRDSFAHSLCVVLCCSGRDKNIETFSCTAPFFEGLAEIPSLFSMPFSAFSDLL